MPLSKIIKTFMIASSISILSSAPTFANAIATVAQENVNVYKTINEESTLVGTLDINKEVTVVDQQDQWLQIAYDDFSDVYIPSQSVSIKKTNAVTNNNNVNIRQQPSLDAPVLGQADTNITVTLTAKVGDWYELDYNGSEAYIYGEYVSGNFLSNLPVETVELKQVSAPATNEALGQQITNYAKQFIGTPYVYGASSLTKGTDCSGFTSSVMRNFGIKLNRSSGEQINNGTRVNKNELAAGDLVFFNSGGKSRISHVGIYIGNSQFIHSSSARTGGVIISSLNEAYYANTYVAGTRVI